MGDETKIFDEIDEDLRLGNLVNWVNFKSVDLFQEAQSGANYEADLFFVKSMVVRHKNMLEKWGEEYIQLQKIPKEKLESDIRDAIFLVEYLEISLKSSKEGAVYQQQLNYDHSMVLYDKHSENAKQLSKFLLIAHGGAVLAIFSFMRSDEYQQYSERFTYVLWFLAVGISCHLLGEYFKNLGLSFKIDITNHAQQSYKDPRLGPYPKLRQIKIAVYFFMECILFPISGISLPASLFIFLQPNLLTTIWFLIDVGFNYYIL